jgi:nucleoside phosphorylase
MWDANRRADVVILTAIRLEYDAAREVNACAVAGSQWEEIDGPNGLPVAFREFTVENGRPLRVALAVSPDMGATAATNTLLPLVEHLQPRCIAMCGVCAGRRGRTNLGDVVVAERLFYHDAGKRLPDDVQQDLTTYQLRDDWKVLLRGLSVSELFGNEAWLQARPLTAEWRANLALQAMLAGASEPWDIDHTMDQGEWQTVLARLREAKLVSKKNLLPTARGRQHIHNLLDANKGSLPDLSPVGTYLPFKLHVAPMASGTQVIEDEKIWSFVSRGMRQTLALEMESAALGELAHRQRERRLDAIVMKAVMDFADHGRDDHFKHFAARASAECLIWFLRSRVPTDRLDQPDPLEGLDRMIDDHTPCVGRSDLLAELSRFIASSRSGRALLMAPTGMGKTTALIEWTRRLQSSPDVWPVFVPISRGNDHATPAAVLGRMVRKLQRCYGDGEPEPLVDVGRTPPVIYRYLQRAPPRDRKLVLVIDGIDEATGWKVPRTLVPKELGERVWVVVAARQHANLDRGRVCEQLGWSERTTTMLGLDVLNVAELHEGIRAVGIADGSVEAAIVKRIWDVTRGDPVKVRSVLTDLKARTLTPEMLARADAQLPSYEPEEIIADLKARALTPERPASADTRLPSDELDEIIAAAADAERSFTLIGILALARGPLSEAEVLALAPDALPNSLALENALRPFSRWVTRDAGAYVIKLPRVREQFVEKLLQTHELEETTFVAWGERCLRAMKPEPYIIRHWIAHLESTGCWDRMRKVVIEPGAPGAMPLWAKLRFETEYSYEGFLDDLDLVWRRAEEESNLPVCLRCALITSTIGTLAERTVPELLAGLVEIGARGKRWPPALAVSYIETMSNPRTRAQAIAQLAPLEVDAEMPFDRLLEIAGRIESPEASGFAIRALVPRMSEALVAIAYFTAATLPEPARGETLGTLIPHLPKDLIQQVTTLLKTEEFGYCTAKIVAELLNRGADIAPYTWLDRLKVRDRGTVIRVLVERGINWSEAAPYAGDLPPEDLARILALVVARNPEVEPQLADAVGACAAAGAMSDVLPALRELADPLRARICAGPRKFLVSNDPVALVQLAIEGWPEEDLLDGAFARACAYTGTERLVALVRLARRLPGREPATEQVWRAAIDSIENLSGAFFDQSHVCELAASLPSSLIPMAWSVAGRGPRLGFLLGLVGRDDSPFDPAIGFETLDAYGAGVLARAIYAANRTKANFMRAELVSRRDERWRLSENLFDLANLATDDATKVRLQREAVAKATYVIDKHASEIHPDVAVEALRDRIRESSIEAFAPRIPIEAQAEFVRAYSQIGGLEGAEALVACAGTFGDDSLDLFTNDAVTSAIVAGFSDWRAHEHQRRKLWRKVRRLPPAIQTNVFAAVTSTTMTFNDDHGVGLLVGRLLEGAAPATCDRVVTWLHSGNELQRACRIGGLAVRAPEPFIPMLVSECVELDPVERGRTFALVCRSRRESVAQMWTWILRGGPLSEEEQQELTYAFEAQPRGSAEAAVVVAERYGSRPFLLRASAWLTGDERADVVQLARAIANRSPHPGESETVAARFTRLAEKDAFELAEYDSEKLGGELAALLIAHHAASGKGGEHRHVPRLLIGAARQLPGELMDIALTLGLSISDPTGRCGALHALFPLLQGDDLARAANSAIEALAGVSLDTHGTRCLVHVVRDCPEALRSCAARAAIARLRREKQFQLHACSDLFPHVPTTEVPIALDMARECPRPGWAAKLVALLAGRATDRATLVEEVLNRVDALTARELQEGDPAGTIATIAKHVPPMLEARAIELVRLHDTRGEARLALAAAIDPREPAAALFDEAIERGAGAVSRASRLPAQFRRQFVETALHRMESRRGLVTTERRREVARLFTACKVVGAEVINFASEPKLAKLRRDLLEGAIEAAIKVPVDDALRLALSLDDDRTCTYVLGHLADHIGALGADSAARASASTWRQLSTRNRPVLLEGACEIMPLLPRGNADDLILAILDVTQAWP